MNTRFLTLTNNITSSFLMVLICLFATADYVAAQEASGGNYYVDDEGVFRNRDTGEEVSFFGANYSPAFAHRRRGSPLL